MSHLSRWSIQSIPFILHSLQLQVEDVKPGDLGEDSKPSLKPKKVSKTKRAKKEYTYPCSQCDEVLRSNKALLDHIINSHKVKCMACSQMFDFTDDQAWQEHEEEHWTKDFAGVTTKANLFYVLSISLGAYLLAQISLRGFSLFH